MLSGPLNLSRFRNGIATPFFLEIDKKNLAITANLVELFENSVERKRFEIDDEIKSFYTEKINPKVIQGMAKILFKRGDFSDFGNDDPATVRKNLFSVSAHYWKQKAKSGTALDDHKQSVLISAGIEQKQAYDETDSWLFGDISNNQKLIAFKPIQAEKLIHRFNIEQVQGLLLHCENLELNLTMKKEKAFRQVMQMLKFYQLMFEVVEAGENQITLKIDGPASILENAKTYGMEIANFFPAILLLDSSWQLTAKLKIPRRHRKFKLELSDQHAYKTFYRKTGIWNHEKVLNLIDRVNEKYVDQLVAETGNLLIPLSGNRYLIPDIILKDKEGQKTLQVEWFHYMSETRIKQIGRIAGELPENYLIAIKGKKSHLKKLVNRLGNQLLVFSKDLTAPALFKRFDSL